MKERKIIYSVAMSADGFIARPDGDVAWLDRPRIAGSYGMNDFFRTIDTVLMGRKTWDVARKLGQTHYPGMKNYVFSRRRRRLATREVELVRGDVAAFARRLREEPGKHVWLVGGGDLFGSFLDAGEVDEIVVHVVPVLIGEGVPLIAPRHRDVPLALASTRRFADGVVRMRYEVRPGRRKRGR